MVWNCDMQPLVSILVPVYNHSAYIIECLNSFINLDYLQIEIILCDDGSTDNSYSLAKEWQKSHPQVQLKLFTQQNQGVCKTLNFLVRQSSGKYIALCASDDVFLPNALTERVTLLEQRSHVTACIGDAMLIDQNSKLVDTSAMRHLYKADYDLLQSHIVDELVLRWAVVGPTLLIRRSAYDEIGFYDENLAVEDRDFYLRLLSKDKLVFVNAAVAKYRIHTDNASRRNMSSRMRVLTDVASSNLKHAADFSGVRSLFLQSHHIDLFLANHLSAQLAFLILLPWRALRKLVCWCYLSGLKWTIQQ